MVAFYAALAFAVAPAAVPEPVVGQWVVDLAGVMTPEEEASVNRTLHDAHAAHAFEVDVVTIPSTDGLDPATYATTLFNLWGIGDARRDDGVLVLLVLDVRRVEIRVGDGLTGALSNERVVDIEESVMVPAFKQGDYGAGITKGVRQLVNAAISPGTTPMRGVRKAETPEGGGIPTPFAVLAFVGVAIVGLLFGNNRRTRWGRLGGSSSSRHHGGGRSSGGGGGASW